MFDFQKMMKQAQKVQEQMQTVQTELEKQDVTGVAGGGAVKITCNCKYEFKNVEITGDAVGDPEMLSDLVLAALKDASNKVHTITEEKMNAVTAGLNIPGLKLPGM